MTDWQINSFLLALHNIARAIGILAMIAGVFLVMGPVFWSHYQRGEKK